jgi:large subunit ribosomal protein L21
MEAYAVIETGGKQYRVGEGQILEVERLEGEAGAKITIDRVLAQSDGTTLTLGTPTVEGAAVTAEVLEQLRAPKVISFKKKRRKGYKKKIGHRQELTRIKIVQLGGKAKSTRKKKAAAEEPAEVDNGA